MGEFCHPDFCTLQIWIKKSIIIIIIIIIIVVVLDLFVRQYEKSLWLWLKNEERDKIHGKKCETEGEM